MMMGEQAEYILQDCGLLEELSGYGTPHVIGSYRMAMMAWNDLDIENEKMPLDKLHRLSQFTIDGSIPCGVRQRKRSIPRIKRSGSTGSRHLWEMNFGMWTCGSLIKTR